MSSSCDDNQSVHCLTGVVQETFDYLSLHCPDQILLILSNDAVQQHGLLLELNINILYKLFVRSKFTYKKFKIVNLCYSMNNLIYNIY